MAALTCCAHLVAAQGDPCAAAIHDGVELRRVGRDAEALARFQAARPTCDAPRLRVQIAWAEQALGRWLAAREDLRAGLAERSDPWVNARRARLEGDLRAIEQHVGALQVLGGEAGAEVMVNGERIATLPMTEPAPLVVGVVRVEVRRAGRYTVVRDVEIAAGAVAREQVELRPLPPDPPPVVPPAVVTPPVVTPPVIAPHVVPPAVVTPPVIASPITVTPSPVAPRVGWALVGVGGASLVAGAVLLGLRDARANDFNNYGAMQCSERDGVALGGAACTSLHGEAAAFGGAAIGTLATGAVLSVVGAVLLLTSSGAPPRTTLVCAPGLLGGGCALRF
jgi:hypothetical protein